MKKVNSKIVILRKVLNPKTGFTKHFLNTHQYNEYKKIIITSKIDCNELELKKIEAAGFEIIKTNNHKILFSIDPDLIEIHGGMMTIFSYLTFFKAFKKYKLLIFIHSTKFSLKNLLYLKFKDIFLERKYTIDGAFLVNALTPVTFYLFVIIKVLKFNLVGITIASEEAYNKYKKIFKKFNINFYYLHSGIENYFPRKRNRSDDGIINIVSFSRGQLVRGFDVLIKSIPYIAKNKNNFKIKLFLLPDVSTHRIVKISQKSKYKNYIDIQIGKADIDQMFDETDIFVFLVRSMRVIPFQPLTVIEALNTGKPVITSNLPEMSELKNHYKNIACMEDYKNPKKLARVILDNIDVKHINNDDVKYYLWETIANLQNKIYKEII